MWQVRKITGHVFLVKIPNNRFWGTLPLQTFLPPKTHSCGKKQFFWVQNLSSSPRNTKWKEMHLYMARKTSEASSLVSNLGPEEPPRNRPVFGWNLTTPSGSIDKTLLKTNVTDWKIPMFNRKYIFIHGGVSTVVLGSIYTSTCKSTRCRWTLCIDIVYIYIYICLKRYKNIYLYNIYIYICNIPNKNISKVSIDGLGKLLGSTWTFCLPGEKGWLIDCRAAEVKTYKPTFSSPKREMNLCLTFIWAK